MKRCPTCNRTFTDQNLSFCTEDGTPLVNVSEAQSTIGTSSDGRKDPAAAASDASAWKAPTYQPPSGYTPPGGGDKRRAWPWVLGITAVLVVGIVVIIGVMITAKILLPRTPIAPVNRNAPTNSTDSERNRNERADLNSNLREDNSNQAGKNSNTDEGDSSNAAPPTDKEQVLAQLTDLEQEWTVANLNADKKALDRILADDYAGSNNEGRTQGKADYIKTIERDTSVQKWNFEDLKLSLRGDRATLTGTVRLVIDNRDVAYHFTDKFVWRDGRWQATGSEVTLVQ
jgi:hypothetical protein